jgi:hypothetical protein
MARPVVGQPSPHDLHFRFFLDLSLDEDAFDAPSFAETRGSARTRPRSARPIPPPGSATRRSLPRATCPRAAPYRRGASRRYRFGRRQVKAAASNRAECGRTRLPTLSLLHQPPNAIQMHSRGSPTGSTPWERRNGARLSIRLAPLGTQGGGSCCRSWVAPRNSCRST